MSATTRQSDDRDKAVKAALKEVGRAEATYEKLLARERRAVAQLRATRHRAEVSGLKRAKQVMLAARQRAKTSTRLRREAFGKLREARNLLREQRQLVREAERKQRAKERAVANFVKKWEREYDLEMKRKKKNIKLRKGEVRRGG